MRWRWRGEIERLGGKVFENSPALSTGRFGASHLVATPRGKVSAHHLVICTGGYTRRLIPALRRAMLPIATYAMASEPTRRCWTAPSRRRCASATTGAPATITGAPLMAG